MLVANIKLHDGRTVTVPADKAITAWNILTGKIEATPEQEKFVLSIKKIYLNYRNAPDDYIEQHFAIIKEQAMADWEVDRNGTPLRPTDDFGWKFSKRWGLTFTPYRKGAGNA